MNALRLSVGPIPYLWPRARVEAFYEDLARSPVAVVYLGEAVCAKRRELGLEDWLAIARGLKSMGKEVVLSTLALIEAESELGALARLCANGEFAVEANDMAAVELLSRAGRRWIAGPGLNIYNGRTLALLVEEGLARWVPPVEMPREDLIATLAELGEVAPEADIEVELFAWGRLPLAHSARCFTARAHGRPKDDCGFVCIEHPDGMPVATQEGQGFLTLNGIQVQSGEPVNLLGDLAGAVAAGVTLLRLSPAAEGLEAALGAFARALAGQPDGPEALHGTNGYWHGKPGMGAGV